MQIDLKNDSILLKTNQSSTQEYVKGKQPPKYFTGKIPSELKDEIEYFQEFVLNKKSGSKLNNPDDNLVLYSGPVTFLEYKKDTTTKYFYIDHIISGTLYDHKLGKISEKLFDFAVNPDSLTLSKTNYALNDDSLVAPIVNRKDFLENALPPPVQKTIKFTPPVNKKKK